MIPAALMIVRVLVFMIVSMRMMGVCAPLRIERRLHRNEPGAESAQHVFDYVITANPQPITDDLHVDMPVADVPGESRQRVTVGGGDFDQRLGAADNTYDATVVEHEAIAVSQGRRVRQVEQKGRTLLTGQHNAAALPLVGIEQNLVDRAGAVPMACRPDCLRALHLPHRV
jgi:hypothetical protein